MFPWQEILQLILEGLLGVYQQIVFWLLIALIGYQYWQLQRSQVRMFGVCRQSFVKMMLYTVAAGALGGLVGSVLLTIAGVNVNQLGLVYIWPVAIGLMLINVRFLCFAYAGGLVALSKLLLGWPAVDVPQIMTLVAALHITESLLIAVSGYSTVPVVLQKPEGGLVGAFNLQNFWPLPLVLMVTIAMPQAQPVAGMLNMPDWWPLLPFTQTPPEGYTWIFAMFPVIAALGYGDIAIASLPHIRRYHSALHLAGYSLVLLVLALLSVHYTWLQLLAALLAPVGHELLIQRDNQRELKGEPRFVPPEQGIMVLDAIVGTPAHAAGLKPGDIVLKIDDMVVDGREQLAYALYHVGANFSLQILRGQQLLLKQAAFREGRQLGIITVPEGNEAVYIRVTKDKYLLWSALKKLQRVIFRK